MADQAGSFVVLRLHETPGHGAAVRHVLQQERGARERLDVQPDLSHQAIIDRENHNFGLRLTAQVTPRNKLNVFWDEQFICKSCENGSQQALSSPESRAAGDQWPVQVGQISWTSPVNNQVLFDVAFGLFPRGLGRSREDRSLYRRPDSDAGAMHGWLPTNGNIAGLIYPSQSVDLFISGRNKNRIYNWRADIARVTGALWFKAGYQGNLLGDIRSTNRAPNNLQYRVNNGVPNQLTMFINDYPNDLWMRTDSLYVQGQWTRNRLTVQGALRLRQGVELEPGAAGRTRSFLPGPGDLPEDTARRFLPRHRTTRLGGLRPVRRRQNGGQGNVRALPRGRVHGQAVCLRESDEPDSVERRARVDVDRDFVADCDLLNPNAQNLSAVGGDICGAYTNRNFGNANVFSNTVNPDIQKGWGVRPSGTLACPSSTN